MKDGIQFSQAKENVDKKKNINNLKRITSFLEDVKKANNNLSESQREEFEKYYEELKSKIKVVFIKVGDYVNAKLSLERVVEFQKFREYNQEEIESADLNRRNAHNALISYISELARFINFNFREDVAEQIKHKNNFIKITPENDIFNISNFKNRENIEAWADSIYEDIKRYSLKMDENEDHIMKNAVNSIE